MTGDREIRDFRVKRLFGGWGLEAGAPICRRLGGVQGGGQGRAPLLRRRRKSPIFAFTFYVTSNINLRVIFYCEPGALR